MRTSTYQSIQTAGSTFASPTRASVTVSGASLQSNHHPGIYSSGAHCSRLPPSSGDISSSISRRLVSLPPRPSSITLKPIPVSSEAKDGGVQIKCSQARTGTSSGHPVSGHSIMSGSGKSITWASGLIPLCRLHLRPLQRHFHSVGLTNHYWNP